jgi:hypothetical protein
VAPYVLGATTSVSLTSTATKSSNLSLTADSKSTSALKNKDDAAAMDGMVALSRLACRDIDCVCDWWCALIGVFRQYGGG